ncbi:lipid-A-disaccharide synthase N-terminal domain-containing protein [Luteimonas sp. 50]|uniref:Lipid-A-disaccharide synthase N-terminal domain-containing protein n=2 Tax=Cognatiluteimonas sedimenti TaxID=2927791 RepID=A0ABT0A616_9GAMM|nr:lipid-A-disaccharide synthase N-terminal domain-containing protein [Lysobacter sedimenti]MCJ0826402.1 lipid-A-disaccharide synthase N-terminal domain-containing protein [Lysobacter sedimenti]
MSLLLQAAAAAPAADFMNESIAWLEWTGLYLSPWKLIGLVGALMFGGRWLVQFLASRKQGKPVIPRLFWYMSLVGSVMTLSYFVFSQKQDSVGVVQNLFPAFTAAYSLYLDIRHRGWHRDRAGH